MIFEPVLVLPLPLSVVVPVSSDLRDDGGPTLMQYDDCKRNPLPLRVNTDALIYNDINIVMGITPFVMILE